MMTRKIVFVLAIACFSFGLNACKSRSNSNQAQIATADNSQTGIDWNGTYSGILPAADCEGIETKISLNADNTYQISWKYIGKDDKVYTNEGTFTWDAAGSIITLKNMDATKEPTMYKVCENHLLQLDLKGEVITGEFADNYVLNKD